MAKSRYFDQGRVQILHQKTGAQTALESQRKHSYAPTHHVPVSIYDVHTIHLTEFGGAKHTFSHCLLVF